MARDKPRIPASVGVGKVSAGQQKYKSSEIVNTGRAMLLRALEVFETNELITPAEHLSHQFKDNPLRFMEIYAKFMPKEVHVAKRKSSADDYSTVELQELLKQHVNKQMQSDMKTIEHEPSEPVPAPKLAKSEEIVVEFAEKPNEPVEPPTGMDAILLGK